MPPPQHSLASPEAMRKPAHTHVRIARDQAAGCRRRIGVSELRGSSCRMQRRRAFRAETLANASRAGRQDAAPDFGGRPTRRLSVRDRRPSNFRTCPQRKPNLRRRTSHEDRGPRPAARSRETRRSTRSRETRHRRCILQLDPRSLDTPVRRRHPAGLSTDVRTWFRLVFARLRRAGLRGRPAASMPPWSWDVSDAVPAVAGPTKSPGLNRSLPRADEPAPPRGTSCGRAAPTRRRGSRG